MQSSNIGKAKLKKTLIFSDLVQSLAGAVTEKSHLQVVLSVAASEILQHICKEFCCGVISQLIYRQYAQPWISSGIFHFCDKLILSKYFLSDFLPCSPHIWDKVFKNGPSKICGRQPLKNLKGYGLFKNNFYLVHLNTLSHILQQVSKSNILSHVNETNTKQTN